MNLDNYITDSDALFHYTKMSTAIEYILPTRKLRASLLKNTNDPREYKTTAIGSLWGKKVSDKQPEIKSSMRRILERESRVICFCSNQKPTIIKDDGREEEDRHTHTEGWSKSRMWSQYGDNHLGVCLVFSKSELEKKLEEKKTQVKLSKANNVKYYKRLIPNSLALDSNEISDNIEEFCYEHIKNHSDELFFLKHVDYRDETEFRLHVIDPNNELEYIDIESSIRCVIVGDRTPKIYHPLIKDMCLRLNIECRKAEWCGSKYHLFTRVLD